MSCENDSFGGNMEFEGSTIDLNKGYSLRSQEDFLSQEIKTRFLANNLIQEVELQCLSPEMNLEMEISQPKVQIYNFSLNQFQRVREFLTIRTFNLAEII